MVRAGSRTAKRERRMHQHASDRNPPQGISADGESRSAAIPILFAWSGPRYVVSPMRGETDKAKLLRFMAALGERVRGEGTVYLTGGATAVLHGWRAATIDVDLKAD